LGFLSDAWFGKARPHGRDFLIDFLLVIPKTLFPCSLIYSLMRSDAIVRGKMRAQLYHVAAILEYN